MNRNDNPTLLSWLVWAVLFIGLPMAVAGWESRPQSANTPPRFAAAVQVKRLLTPPPPVEPLQVYALPRDKAVALNAAVPFSRDPNPAARPFLFAGSETDLARATDCLAAAEIFEAGDDAVGEQAVAQVVLNRVRHPAFPKTVCGVVFQGQERRTGCQFTFSCDGALARTPGQAAWLRAQEIARAALAGKVYTPVGYATHYHTNWVVPYWSDSLDKIVEVGTHIFFRWRGWWGTPPAFRQTIDKGEPVIGRIARFSPAHQGGLDLLLTPQGPLTGEGAAALAAQPQRSIEMQMLGKTIAGVRLISVVGGKSFLVELPKGSAPNSWPATAQTFCAGRGQCRIMAWVSGSAPKELPLSLADMAAMRFSYIHDTGTGLQKALWNCAQTPRAAKGECMRQRVPVAAPAAMPDSVLPGVRRKDRFETVKIAPVAPVAAPVAPPGITPSVTP